MSKLASMTIGLILVFLGSQLFLVKSYLLTPSATRFMAEHLSQNHDSRFSNAAPDGYGNTTGQNGAMYAQPGQAWPYYQTSQSGYSMASASGNSVPARLGSFADVIPPGYQYRFVPPQWIMWPAFFLGTVLFLHGLALRP
jgi:hypothetical protein